MRISGFVDGALRRGVSNRAKKRLKRRNEDTMHEKGGGIENRREHFVTISVRRTGASTNITTVCMPRRYISVLTRPCVATSVCNKVCKIVVFFLCTDTLELRDFADASRRQTLETILWEI